MNNMVLVTSDMNIDINDIQLERGFYWVYSNGSCVSCVCADTYKIVFLTRAYNENYYKLIRRA